MAISLTERAADHVSRFIEKRGDGESGFLLATARHQCNGEGFTIERFVRGKASGTLGQRKSFRAIGHIGTILLEKKTGQRYEQRGIVRAALQGAAVSGARLAVEAELRLSEGQTNP